MNDSSGMRERRQSARVQKHGHAEVKPAEEAADFEPVQLMNVSAGGARFVSSRSFEVGQECILRLQEGERRIKVHDCKQLFKGYAIRSEFLSAGQ